MLRVGGRDYLIDRLSFVGRGEGWYAVWGDGQ
jgi:hypothetical protein